MGDQAIPPPSDPTWAREYRDRTDAPFWVDDIDDKITPEVRSVLEKYSGVPPEEVKKHVYETREKAWAIRSYPCIGIGSWLSPPLTRNAAYASILSRLNNGDSFMDIGCFLGQDLRRLVIDGAPSDKLCGVDIVNYWDLGYEYHRDRERFKARYVVSDFMHPTEELKQLEGTMDIISIMHVLHQWSWDDQIAAAIRLCALSKPGSTIVGEQCGSVQPYMAHNETMQRLGAGHIFWHSVETWRVMWDEVSRATGTRWEHDSTVLWEWEECGFQLPDVKYMGDQTRLLSFALSRKA